MNHYHVAIASAISILPPLTIAFWRKDRLGKIYLPLITLLAVGTINELLSYFIVNSYGTNMINSNIYLLLEFLLVAWLFKRFTPVGNVWLLNLIVIVAVVIWILDNVILHTPRENTSLFRMIGSLLIVSICIDRLNLLLFFNDPAPLRYTDIFLCAGLFVYHLYKTFIETFHVFPIPIHKPFYRKLWLILCVINILMHLLFSLAILWPQRKQTSTTHS